MRWLRHHRLRNYLRASAWPVPTASIPVAVIIAWLFRRLDARNHWRLLNYTPVEANSLLAAITPAALTMVVLILSMLLLAVQLASSQASPRLIGGLLARGPVKLCLSVMVFTYIYCAAIIGHVHDVVPQLSVLAAVIFTMISVGAGLFLIDYLARELRPVRMLARTADIGRGVIEQVYPILISETAGADRSGADEPPYLPPSSETVTRRGRSAVLLAVDFKGLAALAREANCLIEVVPQVGDYVARDDPLFRVYPAADPTLLPRLAASLAFGNERTHEQDPAFAFRILVDVAAKALSPAINDPTTAVLAIDQIHHLLRQVGRRRLDTGQMRDTDGNLRVVYRTPDWEDFVNLAVTEIRQYGSGSIQVARRLRAMLENLIGSVPPDRAVILREQLRLLQSSVGRSFLEPEDRASAEEGDYQGMGGGAANGKLSRAARDFRPSPIEPATPASLT